MPGVSLVGITKTYPNGVVAVAELSLEIKPGEFLVILGPSGCGKTTTLRVVAGLEMPDAGRVRIGKRDVTHEPPYRRGVAMVFQRPALLPHHTVRRNLGFSLRLRRKWWRWPAGRWCDDARRVLQAAELLQLESVLDRKPRELSGGQQQRVALGRALVCGAGLLLMDEPLGSLDAQLRRELRRELHLLRRRLPSTIAWVTHDQEEALALGDRVAVLDRGRLQQADHPEVVLRRPVNRFVAGFVGSPPMSFVEGRIDAAGRVSLIVQGLALDAPAEWAAWGGRTMIVGLRAEHVRLGRAATAEAALTMEVCRVEPLGPDRLVTLTRDGWSLVARCPDSLAVRERSLVDVALDLTGAHLFDAATERVLSDDVPAG